jgi:hypothetical protein
MLSLAAAALLSRGAAAQSASPVEGAAFLLLPVGARATALGQAAAADGGTTEALFWNPAGLAHLEQSELALHHYTAFFGTGDAAVFAFAAPRLGIFTVAAYLVDYGDLDVTPPGGGGVIGRVTPRNLTLSAAYASEIAGGVSGGIAYKLAQFRVDCSGDCSAVPATVGTTHAVDVGIQVAMPGGAPVVIGASLRNLGFKLQVKNQAQADPLPTRLQVGLSWTALRAVPERPGFDLRLLADVQGAVGRGALDPVTLVGAESGVGSLVRLRAGYAFLDTDARGPSVGVGFTVGSLTLDLARVFYAQDVLGEREPFHVSFRWSF